MPCKRKLRSISYIKLTVVLSSLLLSVSSFASDEIYKKATIKKLADKVREYRNKSIKNPNRHNWVFGTYYTGLMAMYESTSDDAYLNQCLEYGEACNWAIPDKTDADWDSTFYSFVFGQVWYGCYQEKKEESILAPTFAFLKTQATYSCHQTLQMVFGKLWYSICRWALLFSSPVCYVVSTFWRQKIFGMDGCLLLGHIRSFV